MILLGQCHVRFSALSADLKWKIDAGWETDGDSIVIWGKFKTKTYKNLIFIKRNFFEIYFL